MNGVLRSRRGFFGASLFAAAGVLVARRASATDYASAAEALAAMDLHAGEVVARLRSLGALPASRVFCERLLREQERQQAERNALRARLGIAAAARSTPAATADRSLGGLRAAQEAAMFAQAEGLPALPDARAVDLIAHHLVASSRQLTLVDLWIEAEEARG